MKFLNVSNQLCMNNFSKWESITKNYFLKLLQCFFKSRINKDFITTLEIFTFLLAYEQDFYLPISQLHKGDNSTKILH